MPAYVGLSRGNDLLRLFSLIGIEWHSPLIWCPALYFNKSLLSVEADVFTHFTIENKEALSVKKLTPVFNSSGKLFI